MMLQDNSSILIYFPMMVFDNGSIKVGKSGADSTEWDKLRALPMEKQNILVSKEMPLKIQSLQNRYRLNQDVTGNISFFIRKFFFGELSLSDCEVKIGSMLVATGGDPNQARAIVEFIQKEILTIQPKPETEEAASASVPVVSLVSLPLLQALSKYERLGNQLITRERIKVKSQPEPVRPSLLYWLKYYRDELGVGYHDSVRRGEFLFRSENGRRLSGEERERVNLILKSVEENLPLAIDTEEQVIVFPTIEQSRYAGGEARPAMPQSQPNPNDNSGMRVGWDAGRTAAVGGGKAPTVTERSSIKNDALTRISEQGGRMERSEAVGGVSFTSQHRLPVESEILSSVRRPVAPVPHFSLDRNEGRKPDDRASNPYHIRPISLGEDEK